MNVQEAINAGLSKETNLASKKFKTKRIAVEDTLVFEISCLLRRQTRE